MSVLNIADGFFVSDDGAVFPVTDWIDSDGDKCAREDAVVCVAGEGDRWFSLPLAAFAHQGMNA